MGEAIVITSGKGGVGKSTTSANLGTALALQGKKVCLIDMDIGLRNLDVILGLENRIVYDIVDVVAGRCKLHQALVKDKRFDGDLFLLPAAQNSDKDAITGDEMKTLIDSMREDYDYIILDCPAGIEQGFKNAIAGADRAIVVATPEISSVRDADRIIGLLEQLEMPAPKLIVNRIRVNMVEDGRSMTIEDITSHLSIELLGIILDDEAVIESSNSGQPVVLSNTSKASIGYRYIARRIQGESVPLMDIKEKKLGFFQRLFGKKA